MGWPLVAGAGSPLVLVSPPASLSGPVVPELASPPTSPAAPLLSLSLSLSTGSGMGAGTGSRAITRRAPGYTASSTPSVAGS